MSIPLNEIVRINPSVLDTGAAQVSLNGLMLSKNEDLVYGVIESFLTPDDVGAFFGLSSLEYAQAKVYFAGFTNAPTYPSVLHAFSFLDKATPAKVRGASLLGVTVAQLQAMSGQLSVVIDGVTKTADVNFSSAQSFSDAANLIKQAFSDLSDVRFSFNTQSFVVSGTTTEASSSVLFTPTPLATSLRLTKDAGAMVGIALNTVDVNAIMTKARRANFGWASFFCAFDPADKKTDLAKWTTNQNQSVIAVLHDTDDTIISTPNSVSWAEEMKISGMQGIAAVYKDPLVCALISAIPCSVDYSAANGRYNVSFRTQTGLLATTDDVDTARILEEKRYNFVGSYASASQEFIDLFPGALIGDYLWIDSYYCQIWFSRNMQNSLMLMLQNTGQVPYNDDGTGMITSALTPVIAQAVNFGVIRAGIALSDSQAQYATQKFGSNAVSLLQTKGWLLSVNAKATGPQARRLRQTPPVYVLYCDGQSVQRILVNSIMVV